MSRKPGSTSEFNWQGSFEPDPRPEHEDEKYLPDELLSLPALFTFTRLLVAFAVVAAVVDFARVGYADTGIPYNYPVFVGVGYFVAVALVLRRMFYMFTSVRDELVGLSERTSVNDVVDIDVYDKPPETIREEIDGVIGRAFHPKWILGGGVVGGLFAVAVMWQLGVLDAYPYVVMNFVYGAGHGLFYAPIAGAVLLVLRISSTYITDIDLLDPDGVGGYREIGDTIVSLIVYGVFLVTIDFVVLSSVSFIGRPLFRTAAFALYGAMLLFLLGLAVLGAWQLRRRLLAVRELKTAKMREQFTDVETSFWSKHKSGESTQEEAVNIVTMYAMFRQLHGMTLWPIDLPSLLRLVVSFGVSLLVAAIEGGYIQLPQYQVFLPT
jgi:hypothetical protein